jgi:hypothetical protein
MGLFQSLLPQFAWRQRVLSEQNKGSRYHTHCELSVAKVLIQTEAGHLDSSCLLFRATEISKLTINFPSPPRYLITSSLSIVFSLIYSLFNDAFSSSDYTASNETMIVNKELERIWNEAIVAYFKVLSRHLPGGTEENHGNLSQDSRSPGRDLNSEPSEYEACKVQFTNNDWVTVLVDWLNLTDRLNVTDCLIDRTNRTDWIWLTAWVTEFDRLRNCIDCVTGLHQVTDWMSDDQTGGWNYWSISIYSLRDNLRTG